MKKKPKLHITLRPINVISLAFCGAGNGEVFLDYGGFMSSYFFKTGKAKKYMVNYYDLCFTCFDALLSKRYEEDKNGKQSPKTH